MMSNKSICLFLASAIYITGLQVARARTESVLVEAKTEIRPFKRGMVNSISPVCNLITDLKKKFACAKTYSPKKFSPTKIRICRNIFSLKTEPISTPESFIFERFMKPGRYLRFVGSTQQFPSLEFRVEYQDYFYHVFRSLISKFLEKHKANDKDFSNLPQVLGYSIEDILKIQPNLANLVPHKVEIELLKPDSMNPPGTSYLRKGKIPKLKWHVLSPDETFLLYFVSTKSGTVLHYRTFNGTTKKWAHYTKYYHTIKNWLQYQNIKRVETTKIEEIDNFNAYAVVKTKFKKMKV